jgi:predicted metal-dependent peptidase
MKEILTHIVEQWYLTEPALFQIFCIQQLEPNTEMRCPVRCGGGRVQYNPAMITGCRISNAELEEMLRIEMIRLLLKHPYERLPEGCLPEAASLGSNMVIDQHCNLKCVQYAKAADFQLPNNECYEWYVNKLDVLLRQPLIEEEEPIDRQSIGPIPGSGDGEPSGDANDADTDDSPDGKPQSVQSDDNGNGGSNWQKLSDKMNRWLAGSFQLGREMDKTMEKMMRDWLADNVELWQDDELRREEINEIIRSTTTWGTLPGTLVEQIIASLAVKMDYRKALSSFHTSILSSKRHLTRMRPNRRSGFAQMGSRYDLAAQLLVAVDVSGSIESKTLQAFYSVVARFFKYGVETIDVVQFDVGLREVVTFKKRPTMVEVRGRGGTSFQEVFDYLKDHRQYDGLLIFTDGYAPQPRVDFAMRTKVLWICRSEKEYKEHHDWMEKTGRACWIEF